MKVYSNLPDSINEALEAASGISFTGDAGQADVFLHLYSYGEKPKIEDPATIIIVAPAGEPGAMDYVGEAAGLGVSEDSIFIVPPGQRISVRALKDKLVQLKSRFDISHDEETLVKPTQTVTIPVLGFKGGVGRTVLATALTFHYANCGEKVALVDLGDPPSTVYYMAKPPLAEGSGYKYARTVRGDIYVPDPAIQPAALLDKLRNQYDRIILDCPPSGTNNFCSAINRPFVNILLVDYDLRTLEITSEMLKKTSLENYLLVANRIPRVYTGTYGAVVADVLGVKPDLEIQADAPGCQSVLETYGPVNDDRGSEIIAARIGELAAQIIGRVNHPTAKAGGLQGVNNHGL
ncbi:MAG: hypothetical protein AB1815_13130 [Bacillota bacterium]